MSGHPASAGPAGPALPAAEEKRAVVEAMFDRVAGDYEKMNRVISLGLDGSWRRRTVERLGLGPGALVLDLACGTGDFGRLLGARGIDCVGVDLSANMLAHAGDGGRSKGGPGRVSRMRADVLGLPVADGRADGVTCGFALRNLVDLTAFLAECARVLRPGGRMALVDAATPERSIFRAGHRLWFGRVVPWLGARLSDAAAYRYLAASTAYLPDTPTLGALVAGAGFEDVEVSVLTFGAVVLVSGTRR